MTNGFFNATCECDVFLLLLINYSSIITLKQVKCHIELIFQTYNLLNNGKFFLT